ncbi:DUF2520 domain-containing protein [Actinomyces sp. F1_1611]
MAELRVGIIGAGRVGPAIASALRGNGYQISGIYARSSAGQDRVEVMLPGVRLLSPAQVVDSSDLVFLAVPDREIEVVAAELRDHWRPRQLVAHLSGATDLSVLAPAEAAGSLTMSLHPAMTFTGTSLDVHRLQGCPIAVTGDPLVRPVGWAIAQDLGGVPFELPAQNKVHYHAALTHGANHLVTVVVQAQRLLAEAGVPPEALAPLARASLEGALVGGMANLTGPVARGDEQTVANHLAELAGNSVADSYRFLSDQTRTELMRFREADDE